MSQCRLYRGALVFYGLLRPLRLDSGLHLNDCTSHLLIDDTLKLNAGLFIKDPEIFASNYLHSKLIGVIII